MCHGNLSPFREISWSWIIERIEHLHRLVEVICKERLAELAEASGATAC